MMMDDPSFDAGKALFQRWRAASHPAMPTDTAPDALTLAAYAEGRLSDAEMELVEAALAADPALLDTLLALRAEAAPENPSAKLVQAAQALVPAQENTVVVPFPARRGGAASRVNAWLAWAAVAASLMIVSIAGFDLGMRTEHAVSAAAATNVDSPADLLDPSDLSGDDVG
jgi:anti-sigma factor RsiW